MLRPSTTLVRNARLLTTQPTRLFSTSLRTMAAGDTGSAQSRQQGQAAGDAWTRRETAQEELYIRAEEKRKLFALREKLAAQRKHLDELDKTIDELTKGQGGEQN